MSSPHRCSGTIVMILTCLTLHCVSTQQCGYDGCYLGERDALNIHLIPHSHDDVGWLKTVDEYYFGLRNENHNVKVESIIDTAVRALMKNEKRRFIYAEMAYLYKWWIQHQNETLHRLVRELVQEGRLQFVSGGWSMNDEAVTHYNDIIDQHTRGMRFLTEEFGECGQPLVAWQIDPFGHSREQASLFVQMAFDAFYVTRIDTQEREYRINNKHLEMIWHSSDDAADRNSIFMGIMEDGYYAPSGFCFDKIMCQESYTNDPDAKRFIDYALEKSERFATNHILIPIGGDFRFQAAEDSFDIIDKLIARINSIPSNKTHGIHVNAFYSTPSCYTRALLETNTTFPTKHEDFLPLVTYGVTAWVGYYTSRPNLKRYVRVLSNLLQCTEKMTVLSGFAVQNELDDSIDRLRQAMGVLQHHDAITGTSKPHVISNYAVLLTEGRDACFQTLFYTFVNCNFYKSQQENFHWDYCEHLNMSACHVSESGEDFVLILFNGYSRTVQTHFRIPLSTKNDAEYLRIVQQNKLESPVLVALHQISHRTHEIPERLNSTADVEAVFPIELPPLGYASYIFTFSKQHNVLQVHSLQPLKSNENIANQIYRVNFKQKTGLLDGEFVLLKGGISVKLHQEICYYQSHKADNGYTDRSSGTYVFNPERQKPKCFRHTKSTRITRSSHVQEIHQEFPEPWLFQVIRIYSDSPFVEFEWTVGPLEQGKEVILRYSTDWSTDGKFFTDSNCRQTMMRERNKREYPGFNQTAPIAGNYYPINCYIGISNCGNCSTPNYRLAIVNDRPQGGGSIYDGQVEVMVHRSSKKDDGLGLGEVLDDRGSDGKGIISRGKHWLLIAPHEEFDGLLKEKTQEVFNEPIPMFVKSKVDSLHKKLKFPTYSGILKSLPSNIRVLTLDRWKNDTFLLRLEHFYSKSSQPPRLAEIVYFEYKDLFTNFDITQIEELVLSGNREVSHLKQRFQWWYKDSNEAAPNLTQVPHDSSSWMNETHISLEPMQIRTFQIRVHYIR